MNCCDIFKLISILNVTKSHVVFKYACTYIQISIFAYNMKCNRQIQIKDHSYHQYS